MGKLKALSLPAALTCAAALLAGCAGGGPLKIPAVSAAALKSPGGVRDRAAAGVAGGANDFAFRLSAGLVKSADKNDNFVCSPYSVWMPLAALANAADAKYKDTLLGALGAGGFSAADVNDAASRMLYDIINVHGSPLRIVNAVFVDKDVTLRKDFAQTYMDYYRGSAMNVDFDSKDAVDAVNRWASRQTNGLVENAVEKFDPYTAAIVNAVYFYDGWKDEFHTDDTREDVFHAPDGDENAYFMLRKGDGQTYYEDDRVQAVPLTFKSGGGLYIILPKSGGATDLLSAMTSEYFNRIQAGSVKKDGTLLLPRFTFKSNVRGLKEALSALGVPLFDISSRPLTGLIEEDTPMLVSDVTQRAVIKVDEKGATAAAMTIIQNGPGAPPPPKEDFIMICNRPFVFVLYMHTTDGGNQILFTGVVNRP